MYTVRIPFPSKPARDQALKILEGLDYEQLDASETQGAGMRALAGEEVEGVKIVQARQSIVFRGQSIPQWVSALAALISWKVGRRVQDKPWAELFLNEELVLVASTSEDVRGTRGLMEVDEQGRLTAWRDGGGNTWGPVSHIQREAVEAVADALNRAKVRKRLKKS